MRKKLSYMLIFSILLLGMCLEGIQTDSGFACRQEEPAEVRSTQDITYTQRFYEETPALKTEVPRLSCGIRKLSGIKIDRHLLCNLLCPDIAGSRIAVHREEWVIEHSGEQKSHRELVEYVHRQDGKKS